MNYGFIKVASAIPATKVADCQSNIVEIKRLMDEAQQRGVQLICFPELSVTSYTCGDLFVQQLLLRKAEDAVAWLLEENRQSGSTIISVIGAPVPANNMLFNAALVIQGGSILGIVPKTYLPNYKEFYEQRWFASADSLPPASLPSATITYAGQSPIPFSPHFLLRITSPDPFEAIVGIELCEDLWSPIPPSSYLALEGADIICNLSASNEIIGKNQYLRSLIAQQSARTICGYIYSSCGYGESTQDVVYGGNALIYENGKLLAESKRFDFQPQLSIADLDIERLRTERRMNTSFSASIRHHSLQLPQSQSPQSQSPQSSLLLYHSNPARPVCCCITATPETAPSPSPAAKKVLDRWVNPHPFVPGGAALNERCEEIFSIQVAALAKRIKHTSAKTVVLGISGGLDSTLALLVCVRAIDKLQRPRADIVGITMPGFGTTDRTYNNALSLMQSLGITIREIPIREACIQHFSDIGHDPSNHDVTYENCQARERTQILMDVANQMGGFVVGTGDLSELALGWCTYNADHMSMYGVNSSVPKTLVKHLVRWVALRPSLDEASRTTLLDIVDTPISPELIPADEQGNITQKTEDLVGPYELHDFFLYQFLRHGFRPRKIYFLALHAFAGGQTYDNTGDQLTEPVGHYDPATIKHWLTTFCRRFFTQQFKRSCLPDGPKVGSVSLSPRGDWRMPSDASYALWLQECNEL